ncbi:hypothetical protein DFR50_101193 [Roseiarcus fermentans]|uniref:Uncharacterized protein n=1 Tax=Roseiarcus fermentans TaxID=1473586 RepID=A0A366FX26_9HYPH|nr:hypothetical protein DFR50_101193 [Roseiarcus fermentans]
MIHSVQFLDRSGQVLRKAYVRAASEMDAFRMLGPWPPGACSVRILAAFDGDDPWAGLPASAPQPASGCLGPRRVQGCNP